MGFSLIPKEEKFFDLFERQAANVLEGAKVFKSLVQEWSVESPAIAKLRDLEHEGDIITHEINDRLNRTFITPFDREDIHTLTGELDDVIDLMQGISTRMQLYRINRTDSDLQAMAEVLVQATATIVKAVTSLRDIKSSRRILDYCIEINRLENDADRILERSLGKLFLNNNDPIEIMKWKEVFEVTEMANDKCEDVAIVIESIVVKHG